MYIARGSLHFYILPSGSYIFIYCQAVRTFLYIARRFVHFYIMPSGPYILNIAAGCVYFLYYQGVYILLYKHLDLHCVPFRWVSWAEKKWREIKSSLKDQLSVNTKIWCPRIFFIFHILKPFSELGCKKPWREGTGCHGNRSKRLKNKNLKLFWRQIAIDCKVSDIQNKKIR